VDVRDFEEYRQERYAEFTWYEKVLSKTVWKVMFWIQDRVDMVKFKLYRRLFYWMDCLPPVEIDELPAYARDRWLP
jgi:hypothetical protein